MSGFLAWRGHAVLALPMRVYLGVVFSVACIHKIADPGTFALDVATYDLLPLVLINAMAIILPWVELVAGALLIIGYRTRAAAFLVAGMMVMFLVAVIWALAQGLETSCGCFASQALESDPISGLTVLRDVGWLALALYVFFFDRRPLGVDGWLLRRAERRQAGS